MSFVSHSVLNQLSKISSKNNKRRSITTNFVILLFCYFVISTSLLEDWNQEFKISSLNEEYVFCWDWIKVIDTFCSI